MTKVNEFKEYFDLDFIENKLKSSYVTSLLLSLTSCVGVTCHSREFFVPKL